MKITKEVFTKRIEYLKELEEKITAVNSKYGFNDNNLIYAYWFSNDIEHWQFAKRMSEYTEDKWGIMIYSKTTSDQEEFEQNRKIFAKTPEDLWLALVKADLVEIEG